MKAKLIKNYYGYEYFLADETGSAIATSDNGKLSKQNCDEIFGVVDVEKLAIECDLYEKINFVGQTRAYKAGFNKAIELNKDKVFTIEDMERAIQFGLDGMYGYEAGEDGTTKNQMKRFIQSLQQPTEIEVEIEMEVVPDFYSRSDEDGSIFTSNKKEQSKLDLEGCLILKRVV
jgi:hypothetical protein